MVQDIDGNSYNTTIIGVQEWSVENLNVEHYRNGDLIPQIEDNVEWVNLKTGAWCYYDNNPENGEIYGKLYNWYAVNDPRGLAPEGWHIPNDSEWTELIDYLEETEEPDANKYLLQIKGKDFFLSFQGWRRSAADNMKSTSGWKEHYGGTNESGFTALPGGVRTDLGNFEYINEICNFLASSDFKFHKTWNYLICDSDYVQRVITDKLIGSSVRCVRD